MLRLSLLAALAASRAGADATPYAGRYAVDGACDAPAATVEITPNTLRRGASAPCTLARPVEIRDMPATLFDLRCPDDGTARIMLLSGTGGVWLLHDRAADRLWPCP